MNYDGTVNDIQQIVQWLESTDEEGWQDWTPVAQNDILPDVTEMAASHRRPDKGPVEILPGDPKMQLALPHVRDLVRAMQSKNKRQALESGKAALEKLQTG
jgi:hypothetical protein